MKHLSCTEAEVLLLQRLVDAKIDQQRLAYFGVEQPTELNRILKELRSELARALDKTLQPRITEVHSNLHAYFDWAWPEFGFGQLVLSNADGKITIDAETINPVRAARLLYALADHLVQEADAAGNLS